MLNFPNVLLSHSKGPCPADFHSAVCGSFPVDPGDAEFIARMLIWTPTFSSPVPPVLDFCYFIHRTNSNVSNFHAMKYNQLWGVVDLQHFPGMHFSSHNHSVWLSPGHKIFHQRRWLKWGSFTWDAWQSISRGNPCARKLSQPQGFWRALPRLLQAWI